MKSVLDTNVIVRYLVRDNEDQFLQAEGWLREAQAGKRSILIDPLVIAETCFVLESFYKNSRERIVFSLQAMLKQRWLSVREEQSVQAAWKWYLQGFHFVDSFLIAMATTEHAKLLTFDRKALARVP